MSTREQVLEQALTLPPGDQAFVANALEDHLIANLVPQTLEAEGLTEESFLAELQRRSAAYRSGITTARPAADVLADLRQRQTQERRR